MKAFRKYINPLSLSGFTLLLSALFGLTGKEHEVVNFNFHLLYFLLLFISGLGLSYLAPKNTNPQRDFKPPKGIRNLALVSLFVSCIQLARVLPLYAKGIFNPRLIEYSLSGTPILTQISLIQIPFLFYYILSHSDYRKKNKILFVLALISTVIIPIKTFLVNAIVLITVAAFFKGTLKVKRVILTTSFILILIPLVSFLRIKTAKPDYQISDSSAILEFASEELRRYTSFNISNLCLESYDINVPPRLGKNVFGQLADPILYFLSLGQERIIDRSISKGGLYHVIDGRFLKTYYPGANMGTAIRSFIYDFDLVGYIIFYLTMIILSLIYYNCLKSEKLSLISAILLLVGLFSFWDWDLFETRYIFWSLIALISKK